MTAYRSDVDALAARTESLAAEVATKTRELDGARALLDEARAKARLPVLPNIKVATPCPVEWNSMTHVASDERIRSCATCEKNVYNISSLTREEAEALIIAKEGKLCVRYFQRHDGTILLKDCAVGVTQKRKRRVLAASVLALLGGAVVAGFISRPKRMQCSGAALNAAPSQEAQSMSLAGVSWDDPAPPAPITVEAPPPPDFHDIRGKISIDRFNDPLTGEDVRK